jgi:hypothetical protein
MGQLEEHRPEVRLMGAADAEVFSRGAANPAPGLWENLDGRVNLPHLGFVGRIPRNAKLVVQGPQAAGRAVKTILVKLIQPESDFAHGVDLGGLCGLAAGEERVQAEKEAYQESDAFA